jgi:nucleolar protein 12
LSFDAQEEELWLYFESCGEIENVRIVRDNKTNVGKGFAFVQFKASENFFC